MIPAQLHIKYKSLLIRHSPKELKLLKLIKKPKQRDSLVKYFIFNLIDIEIAAKLNKFVPAVGTYTVTDRTFKVLSKPKSYK